MLNFVYIAIKLYMCEIWIPIALTSLNIDMSEKFENINGKNKDNDLHSTTQKSKELATGTASIGLMCIRYTERVHISCSTNGSPSLTLVENPLVSQERRIEIRNVTSIYFIGS